MIIKPGATVAQAEGEQVVAALVAGMVGAGEITDSGNFFFSFSFFFCPFGVAALVAGMVGAGELTDTGTYL